MEQISKAKVKELLQDAPTAGFAEIILKDPKRTGSIVLRDYHLTDDEGTRSHRPFVDMDGNHRIVKITKKKKLKLSNANDRLEYMQAKLHPIFTEGPTPILIVINKEEEANDFILEKDLEAKVNGIIQKLSGLELQKFARLLLVKVNVGSSDSAIKRVVYEQAESNPIAVLEAWEDPERPLKELIRSGVIKKVFTTKNGRWSCEGALTGTSFESTLEWLKENEDLLPKLRKQIFS
jgi:hypothetical protein